MAGQTENSNGSQTRSRVKGVAKKTVKRLDFAVRRPVEKKPTAVKPAPEKKSTPVKPAPKPAPKPVAKPAVIKPAPKKPTPVNPAPNHGRFMDFVPSTDSSTPVSKPKTPVSRPKPAPVSKPKSPVSRPKPAPVSKPKAPVSRPKPAPTLEPKPSVIRPFRKSRPAPTEPAKPKKPELDQPLLDETELNIASTFDEELDALESISDDIFDDIDGTPGTDNIDAIEREIEAEASDFVREPKPLFEDPLVQISKVRDEHRHKKEAKAAAEFKEKTKEEAKKASYLAPYTLGGRSPFLTSVSVEKRPLSAPTSVADGPLAATSAGATAGVAAGAPTKLAGQSGKSDKSGKSSSKSAKSSGKKVFRAPKISWTAKNPDYSPVKLQAPGSVLMENSYRNQMKRQLDQDAKEIHRQTMMAAAPEDKKRRPGLIIAIILTVLLGAGVGAIIYLIFFQQ